MHDIERLMLALVMAAAAVPRCAADLLEHLLWDSDLGHLEDNIAAVAHHLRADLDQLVLQGRQRPVLDRLRRRQRAQEIAAPHLTRRRRAPLRRFAADNPAYSRIVAQALGVVHILVSGKATKYRLPEQPGQCVPTILAGTCVGKRPTRHRGQPKHVVEFAIGEQPSIGGHHGAAKPERQAAVEMEPKSIRCRFTR